MKRNKLLIKIYVIVFLVSFFQISWLVIDRELSFYNQQFLNIYKPLPYNLVLDDSYTYPNVKVFREGYDGFSFINLESEHKINDTTFVTYSKIIDYSFNRKNMLINVIDSNDVEYSIYVYQAPNPRYRNHCTYQFYNKGEISIEGKKHIYLNTEFGKQKVKVLIWIQFSLSYLVILLTVYVLFLAFKMYKKNFVE